MYIKKQHSNDILYGQNIFQACVTSIFIHLNSVVILVPENSVKSTYFRSRYEKKYLYITSLNYFIFFFKLFFTLFNSALFIYFQGVFGGFALPGPCPVDCFNTFVAFLSVMCLLKFFGSTGRATNFLVSVRYFFFNYNYLNLSTIFIYF